MPSVDLMPPYVSVVMCTRDRPEGIEQAVISVLASNYPAFDLTVIDQSTTTATETILQPIAQRDQRLHYVRSQEPGLSRAYNTGIAHTSGDLLAFTDDDCAVAPQWLRTIVDAFEEDEEADLLYGQVLPPDATATGEGITPALSIPRLERFSRRDGFRVCGMGANFAARRRLFLTIGGFDEMLGGGAPLRSSQDFDLAYRTYLAGRAILLRPEIQVIHYGTRAPQAWPATLRAYGIGDGAFYFKHVRCRDFFALRLLVRQIVLMSARALLHRLRRQGPGDWTYVRFVLVGIRECLRFSVDRHSRLYIAP